MALGDGLSDVDLDADEDSLGAGAGAGFELSQLTRTVQHNIAAANAVDVRARVRGTSC
ncbi:MAG TPA: hypothetical protein VFD59_17255 [Nocardioidaceae bacterium]|nr:hypothetical protein [Nocardioidaceae bacterium]